MPRRRRAARDQMFADAKPRPTAREARYCQRRSRLARTVLRRDAAAERVKAGSKNVKFVGNGRRFLARDGIARERC